MKRLVFLFLILSLSGCTVNPVTGKQDFVVLSEEQEIQMSREYNAQILDSIKSTKMKKYKTMFNQSVSL